MTSKKPQWVLANEEDGVSIWSLGLWTPAFHRGLKKRTGFAFPHYFIFSKDHMQWFLNQPTWENFVKKFLPLVLRQPARLARVNTEVERCCSTLHRWALRLETIDWSKLSDRELAGIFERHQSLVDDILGWGLLPPFLDAPTPHLTNAAFALLQSHVAANKLLGAMSDYFNILTEPKQPSIQRLEQQSLEAVARSVMRTYRKQRITPHFLLQQGASRRLIDRHVKKFSWAYYGYVGPAMTAKTAAQHICELVKELPSRRQSKSVANLNVQRLGLSAIEKQLFEQIRRTVEMKLHRRDIISFSFFAMRPALREVAHRFSVPLTLVQHLGAWEITQALRSGQKLTVAMLRQRASLSVLDGTTSRFRFLVGRPARQFIKTHFQPEKIKKVSVFEGQPACPGRASGRVKIVNVASDIKKMKRGDVLISIATTPELVSAMKLASAIVTEQGGITSHAAIVSRELKIPCVVGTKIATKVLKDGDRVEVDATKGIVKKI